MRIPPETVAALAAQAAEVLPGAAASPLLLICEHAGTTIPAPWGDLGLPAPFFATHYAFDPGVEALTRALSARLAAPAVLARWSRIFLDYNRFPENWDHIRPDLGGIPVPGNLGVTPEEAALRRAIAAEPLDTAIAALVPGRRAVVGVHSFTPVMAGHHRPVDIGILWRERSPFVEAVLAGLHARAGGLRIGDNAPYDWTQVMAYSLQTHGLDHGLPCFYLEVNNALFSEPETAARVTDLLAGVLAEALPAARARSLDSPRPTV